MKRGRTRSDRVDANLIGFEISVSSRWDDIKEVEVEFGVEVELDVVAADPVDSAGDTAFETQTKAS